jgi:hypothetical protein
MTEMVLIEMSSSEARIDGTDAGATGVATGGLRETERSWREMIFAITCNHNRLRGLRYGQRTPVHTIVV